jgi:hypothetical protein
MRFATVWEYCKQQWFQNMTKEVLCVAAVLLSHQIEDVESIDSPDNGPHAMLGLDLLLHLWRDIISQSAPFHRTKKFQTESTLLPHHKSLKFTFLVSLKNRQ